MPRPLTHRPNARTRRRRLIGVLLVTALLAGTAGSISSAADAGTTPATPAPAGDAFYTPPSPLPAGAPGDVIRWRRATIAPLFGGVAPAKADAYQVMYLSTDNADKPIAITGTVFVPQGKSLANIPIIGYAPSTHGIADACAASNELVAGTDTDLININDAITRGWAVADGDYQGLGTPGDHTYVIGRAEAHSVLDSVRAAQRLTVAGLPAAGPVGLWGYSRAVAAWAGPLSWPAATHPSSRSRAAPPGEPRPISRSWPTT